MKDKVKSITKKLKEVSKKTPSKLDDSKSLIKIVKNIIKPKEDNKEKIVKKVKALLKLDK